MSESFSTLFDDFRAGQKTSKRKSFFDTFRRFLRRATHVKKRQNVFRHFSTIFARHHFTGPFWGALKIESELVLRWCKFMPSWQPPTYTYTSELVSGLNLSKLTLNLHLDLHFLIRANLACKPHLRRGSKRDFREDLRRQKHAFSRVWPPSSLSLPAFAHVCSRFRLYSRGGKP